MHKRTNLLGGVVALCLLIPSCFVPETFTAKLRITKDYKFTFEFEGVVVAGLAIEQFALKQSLDAEDDAILMAGTDEFFPKNAGFESASYKGNGRYKVKYKREGVLGRKITFFDETTPLMVLTRMPNGAIQFAGLTVNQTTIAELKKAKCQVNGTLEVVTDCKVVQQNATETPTTSGAFTTYTWKVTSEKPMSPEIVLETPATAILTNSAAVIRTPGTNSLVGPQPTPAALAALAQGYNPMALTLRSGDTKTVLQPSRPEFRTGQSGTSRALVNVATFSGTKSSLRITNTTPVFTLALPANLRANDFVQLVRPDVTNDQRHVEMVMINPRTGKQIGKADVVAVKIEPDEGATAFRSMTNYRVTPVKPLPSGEYVLRYAGSMFIEFGVDL